MNFTCTEKFAGFAELDFYLLEETGNWPFVVTDTTSGQVVLNSFENDVEALIEPDSIAVDVSPKLSSDGELHSISIVFRCITRSEALEQLLEQYSNQPGIAIGKLNNDFKKMYGTNTEPLYLNYETNDGVTADGKAFTEVRIKGETRTRPVYYTP
jgi:hypothetical protein